MKFECTLYRNGLMYKNIILDVALDETQTAAENEEGIFLYLNSLSKMQDWSGKWEVREAS